MSGFGQFPCVLAGFGHLLDLTLRFVEGTDGYLVSTLSLPNDRCS
jgi:hypothetical protein